MTDTPEIITLKIKSDLKNLCKTEALAGKIARMMDLSRDRRDNLSIALTEAAGNAITHGNKNDFTKDVSISAEVYSDRVTVSVHDEGDGFEPEKLDDPLAPENLMKESGRGIFIMQALAEDVRFSFDAGGTTLQFTIAKEAPAP